MRASGTAALFGLALAFGLIVGLGSYTFIYANGFAYLTNDPTACASCHIMEEQYSGWLRSSHKNAAACNDCHTPQGFLGKYMTKASNGFWHSFAFTTGRHPEPLRIKEHNRAITEARCRSCHGELASAIEGKSEEQISCLRCHRNVGHRH
jgi:cytochrome c nitrite reductase small subunit